MQSKLSLPLFSSRSIALASFIYKNLALLLLAALFAVFIFYGILISFFLFSTNWTTPVTLSEGHQLVEKMKYKINDLKVQNNLIEQKIENSRQKTKLAEHAMEDAMVLMDYVGKTVDRESEERTAMLADMTSHLQDMEAIQVTMGRTVGKIGAIRELDEKFSKRLINRQTYSTGQLAILEMKYRLLMLEAEISNQNHEKRKLEQSLKMLESLKNALQSSSVPLLAGADTELLPLANQVVAVRTAQKNAKEELLSNQRQLQLLSENRQIIHKGINSLSRTPLARAIKSSVVVLFVPYGNIHNFKKNAPLYSCRVEIFWCSKVGSVLDIIEGETISLHPFFGKNLRGSFFEARLDNPEAAKKELLHVNRPPLFF